MEICFGASCAKKDLLQPCWHTLPAIWFGQRCKERIKLRFVLAKQHPFSGVQQVAITPGVEHILNGARHWYQSNFYGWRHNVLQLLWQRLKCVMQGSNLRPAFFAARLLTFALPFLTLARSFILTTARIRFLKSSCSSYIFGRAANSYSSNQATLLL